MKKLTAGPLTLNYSEGSLWNITDGSEEVIRRIYLVFQDINWTSRPFTIKNEEWQINEKSFTAKLPCLNYKIQNFLTIIKSFSN